MNQELISKLFIVSGSLRSISIDSFYLSFNFIIVMLINKLKILLIVFHLYETTLLQFPAMRFGFLWRIKTLSLNYL